MFRILVLTVFLATVRDWPAQQPSELMLVNGAVYTVDEKNPWAEAVLVRGNEIVAVGTTATIEEAAGKGAQRIDLKGRLVLPGFIDTHVHLASAAQFHEFNLMRTATQDEFVRRVSELVKTLPDGEWVTGGLWGAYDQWDSGSSGGTARKEPFAPDMEMIEAVTPNHPVWISRFDGSEYAANRLALAKAGIDPENPAGNDGIEFIRDASNRFTGRMRGAGVRRAFNQVVPREFSYERRTRQTLHALEMAASHGVTTVSDMSDDMQLTLYRDLRRQGKLDVRIDFRYTLDRWEEVSALGIRTGSGDDWIRLGGLKGFIDGIMGTSAARFFEPYSHQPDNRGSWREMMKNKQGDVDPEYFYAFMKGADRAGLQITVHAIGDEANHLLLDFVERLEKDNGNRDRRFRLVHAQVVAPPDFSRIGQLGIIAEVQPFHLSDDMRWMEERIGSERCKNAYAFRSIQESGARLCFGSDWPGTSAAEYPINPMLALYAAVTRQTVNGTPAEGWFPDQRISLETAIRCHTLDAAYALFEERFRGSIEPGKLADLVVMSDNLFEIEPSELLTAHPVATIVDGKIVYRKDGF